MKTRLTLMIYLVIIGVCLPIQAEDDQHLPGKSIKLHHENTPSIEESKKQIAIIKGLLKKGEPLSESQVDSLSNLFFHRDRQLSKEAGEFILEIPSTLVSEKILESLFKVAYHHDRHRAVAATALYRWYKEKNFPEELKQKIRIFATDLANRHRELRDSNNNRTTPLSRADGLIKNDIYSYELYMRMEFSKKK